MGDQIRIMGPRDNRKTRGENERVINVTSRNAHTGLSPFHIGPCPIPGFGQAKIMENAWQFSKLYQEHADEDGNPTNVHWSWAKNGWYAERPFRYPMGRGARPLCSLWDGQRLGYIDARKQIYLPLYRDAVKVTADFKWLQEVVATGQEIALWDYDGYDHERRGMSLHQVLNEPRLKMGHAFVLKMMLVYGVDFTISDLTVAP